MNHKFLLVLLPLLLWNSETVECSAQEIPNMLVILVDGFRWDYTEIHKGAGLPGFDYMNSVGVRAQFLNPVFPPNSFPNWHTLVTGLYPESHGIVSNFMYDPARNVKFDLYDLNTTLDPDWWGDVEPLWVTTTKNDIDTALFYWSRCDVAFDGVLPKYCIPYDYVAGQPHHFVRQLHQALDMIQGENYKFVMLYTGSVDSQGHIYGPESPEVAASVKDVDAVLQGLWEALETREMQNTTNVVILSDHGMTSTTPEDVEFVDISTCIDQRHVISAVEYGSYINLLTSPGHAQQVVESLKTCQGVKDKVDVHLKEELHERYHYRNHRLIHEIIIIAKPGYYIRSLDEIFTVPEQPPVYMGDHGYDDTFDQNPNMRGILYAVGPSFAEGVEAGAVEQVDIYDLLCRALRLTTCHANNGTMSNIDMFFNPAKSSSVPATFSEFIVWVMLFIFSIFIFTSMSVLLQSGLVF